jgi:RNA polymerase sigma-70 factor, ECF subfamily
MAGLLDPVPARKRASNETSPPPANPAALPAKEVLPVPLAKSVEHDVTRTHRAIIGDLRAGSLVEKSDGDLVLQSIKEDTEAYNELVSRYQQEVRNLARSIVRDYQAAEDLSQDAFIKAYHSLADLKEPHKFGSWICTILRHTALDYLRSHRNIKSLESLQEEGFEPERVEERDGTGSAVLEVHEEEMRTMEALRKLREDYREIIVLKHVEKLSYKEIAKRLNMSVSAVGEKLSRVRALLKRKLEKRQFKDGTTGEMDGVADVDAPEDGGA